MLPVARDRDHEQAVSFVLGIQDNYQFQVRSWVSWMDREGYRIDQEGVGKYFSWLNAQSGFAARTIANKRSAVKKRIRTMYKSRPYEDRAKMEQFLKDLDENHDTAAPKPAKSSIGRDAVIPFEKYETLLKASKSARHRLFFRFLVSTGLRVSEAVTARYDAMTADGPEWYVLTVRGKGSKGVAFKERSVSVPAAIINEIHQVFHGSAYLFETRTGRPMDRNYISRVIKKLGYRIGMNVSAHTLRHTFATNYLQLNPGKVAALSSYLGHSSVSITLSYYVHEEVTKEQLRRLSA
jgi:integrase/recombinase XerD